MINGINHLTLAVTDIERSFNFYHDVLGFKPLCRWHAGAYFLTGTIWFCLTLDLGREKLGNTDYTHIAFDVTEQDFESMKERLIGAGCQIYKENKSEGNSLYFLDPDHHQLEIHVGSWQSRISAKKLNPGTWQDIQFFVD